MSEVAPLGYFTDTRVTPTPSGQYAVSMFNKQNALDYNSLWGGKRTSNAALNRVKNYNINDATVFVTNDKPMVDTQGNVTGVKQSLENDFWGSRTGKSSEGIRAIANTIKNKASALPRNELLSMKGFSPELNDQYGRIAKRAFPDRYFKGTQDINYIAPPGMSSGVMRWLSKVLPGANLTSIPQAVNLYNNIKKMGPQAGYAKWLGLETQNTRERIY